MLFDMICSSQKTHENKSMHFTDNLSQCISFEVIGVHVLSPLVAEVAVVYRFPYQL